VNIAEMSEAYSGGDFQINGSSPVEGPRDRAQSMAPAYHGFYNCHDLL
jgi:hypothetical protein